MRIFLQLASCFLALHAATLVNPTLMEWEEYKVEFGKSYETQEEEQFRMKVFMDRRAMIAEHNEKFEKGEVTYKMGINRFSDMLSEEYMNPPIEIDLPENVEEYKPKTYPSIDPPPEVNWVTRGDVSPVKDQENCDAGYAFSITGAMESRMLIANRPLVSLSEQNIIDCSSHHGCSNCSLYRAYMYVMMNFGLDTEAGYPYEAREGPCRYTNKTRGAQIVRLFILVNDNEQFLQSTIYNEGPTSNFICASDNFYHYHSGIFKDPKCKSLYPNHSVLVVGYGVDNATNQEYWLVKNSWGTKWGENGYIKMARNEGNMCDIAGFSMFPQLSNKDTDN